MSRTSVRVVSDYQGIGELLRSGGVAADLRARGERMAQAARGRGIQVEGRPGKIALPVDVNVREGRSRVLVAVAINHPSGIAVEAKHRLLVGSIDAAH
jgi:hypothetical protein